MGGIPTLLTHIVSIKREIGHLCHDEGRQPKQGVTQAQTTMTTVPPAAQVSAPSTSLFARFASYLSLRFCPRYRRDMDIVCVIGIMHLELLPPFLSAVRNSISVLLELPRDLRVDCLDHARSAHDILHRRHSRCI